MQNFATQPEIFSQVSQETGYFSKVTCGSLLQSNFKLPVSVCVLLLINCKRKQNIFSKCFDLEIIRNSLYFILTLLYLATVQKYNQPAVSYYKPVP